MKKIIVLAVVVILVVVSYRALQFRSPVTPPPQNEQVEKLDWDADYLADGLAQAIRFATVSNQDVELVDRTVFANFHQFLQKRFPLVFSQLKLEQVKDDTLLLSWEGENKDAQAVLFLAHQDVVPVIPGTENDWAYPPYAGVVADGYIWGRGALDDKASLIGILEATERALAEGFVPPRKIYLAFGHDEEVGGTGAIAVAELLAKRGERLAFLLDEGGVIAKDMVPGITAPVALIGPAEKGYVSLKLSAKGDGGHSSMPPKHSAAGVIARAVQRLEENPFPADMDLTIEFFRYLGDELTFLQKALFANNWLFKPLLDVMLSSEPVLNAGIRTTTAVTMLQGSVKDNVLPITASAVVNFRVLPGDSIASVTERVRAIINDERVSISEYGFGSEPSKVANLDSAGFKVLSEVIQAVDPNIIVTPRLVVGATDARHFEGVAENSYRFIGIEIGPEELRGFHGTNERVSVAGYVKAVEIYYRLISRVGSL